MSRIVLDAWNTGSVDGEQVPGTVGEAVRGIILDDGNLEYLWEQPGSVMIDENECILEEFPGFAAGTFREEIWHWFDERYSKGVAGLMMKGYE